MRLTVLTTAGYLLCSAAAFAQTTGVDPNCMMKNADGTETVDMTKCPDGKTMSSSGATAPAAGTDATTTDAPAMTGGIFVAGDALANTKVITASDFIGKRIYSKAGEDLGEVNDVILTDSTRVAAVILGVGGFLGIGEKDVAVSMSAINFIQDGDAMKLVVDASKDQLTQALPFDRKTRTYMN